jgi:hypothetical protein
VIGAIARAHGDDPGLRGRLQPYQQAALDDIAACGTSACGLHHEVCDHCGDGRLVPNTCGHRSCPHCQGAGRAAWVEARGREMLPGIGFFHVVCTVPPAISLLAMLFPRVVLDAILRASADAVLALCRDPEHLGAEVGIVEVLHTWTRDLRWHPHVHMIVTAGGWDAAEQQWREAKRFGHEQRAFLLPVNVLRAAYQRRLVRLLMDAYRAGAFTRELPEVLPHLVSAQAFCAHLTDLLRIDWVIRIERPFGSPDVLLKYLGAYINRVAISPKRITAHDPTANDGAGRVTWTYCTNAKPDVERTCIQTGAEFLAAFAQHILPPRLVRIRFRGLWSTAHRRTKLDSARRWLIQQQGGAPPQPPPPPQPAPPIDPRRQCQACGHGTYQRIPGPCPRPTRAQRRSLLAELRRQERTGPPAEVHASA